MNDQLSRFQLQIAPADHTRSTRYSTANNTRTSAYNSAKSGLTQALNTADSALVGGLSGADAGKVTSLSDADKTHVTSAGSDAATLTISGDTADWELDRAVMAVDGGFNNGLAGASNTLANAIETANVAYAQGNGKGVRSL